MKHYTTTKQLLILYNEVLEVLQGYDEYFSNTPGNEQIGLHLDSSTRAVVKLVLEDFDIGNNPYQPIGIPDQTTPTHTMSDIALLEVITESELRELEQDGFIEFFDADSIIEEILLGIIADCGIFKEEGSIHLYQVITQHLDIEKFRDAYLSDINDLDNLEYTIRQEISRIIAPAPRR